MSSFPGLTLLGWVVQQKGYNYRSDVSRACLRQRSAIGPLAGIAQSVEHLFCKQEVRGSSPLASSEPSTRLFEPGTRQGRSLRDPKEGCPSGQWERAVNPPAYAYGGSNPPPSTVPIKRDTSLPWLSGWSVQAFLGWHASGEGAIARVPSAGVAQLVERQPSKLNVEGSNPFSRSTRRLACRAARGFEESSPT